MMAMMKRIGMMIAMLALGISVVLGVFTVSGNYFASKSYIKKVEKINGSVSYADAGFVVVEFDGDIIKDDGDTIITTFITSADGKNFQLKTLVIPEGSKKSSKTVVFPISDIASLLQLEVYAMEVYVKNTKYNDKYIKLPLVILDFNEWFKIEPEKKETI